MTFKIKCLYCGRYHYSANYSCTCRGQKWLNRYRSLDLKIDYSQTEPEAIQSFHAYSFNDPKGMLQYKLLPHKNYGSDIFKTVGLTPLCELPDYSSTYKNKIFLKDEGFNPSGCFKDRESMMCVLNSNHLNLNKAVIYSSGNAAASAAMLVEHNTNQIITFVSGDTYPEKIDYICDHGSDVIVIGGEETNFEEGYRLFSDMNTAGIFVENNFDNWSVRNPYRVQGDKTIALEIVKQLSQKYGKTTTPDYVIVPTANGSCLAGIWKGFKELQQIGIIDQLPKMVSTGIKNASPVNKAVKQNRTDKPVRCDLSMVDEEDAEVGSIILAEEGYDSLEAAKAVIESGGYAIEMHASDIQESLIHFLENESQIARNHAILPEPAAVTSLSALKKLTNRETDRHSQIYVAISTGHGLKAQERILELLAGKPQLQKMVHEIVEEKTRITPASAPQTGQKVTVEANISAIHNAFIKLQRKFNAKSKVQPI